MRTIGVDPGAGPGPAGLACLDGDTILRLERLPPYTSYGALADRAAAVRRAVGAAAVLVEATAARPFLDLLAAEGLAPVAFVLTGGAPCGSTVARSACPGGRCSRRSSARRGGAGSGPPRAAPGATRWSRGRWWPTPGTSPWPSPSACGGRRSRARRRAERARGGDRAGGERAAGDGRRAAGTGAAVRDPPDVRHGIGRSSTGAPSGSDAAAARSVTAGASPPAQAAHASPATTRRRPEGTSSRVTQPPGSGLSGSSAAAGAARDRPARAPAGRPYRA